MGIFDSLADFSRMLWIEDDFVRVRIGLTDHEFHFRPGKEETPEQRTERVAKGDPLTVHVQIINRQSGKAVRGFDRHINPWWLRQFVYALAHGVEAIEREWGTLPDDYVKKIQNQ
jgi:hypothetical protein